MLEFGLSLPILLLLLSGIIDFGFIFSDKIAVTNAARNGVRFATTHPTAWSNAATPAPDTIEGVIQSAGGTAQIPNDDTHIRISYLTANGTSCGRYSAATGSFSPAGSQSTCVKAGNLIQVQVTYVYTLMTPGIRQLVGSTVSLTSTATMVEEQ